MMINNFLTMYHDALKIYGAPSLYTFTCVLKLPSRIQRVITLWSYFPKSSFDVCQFRGPWLITSQIKELLILSIELLVQPDSDHMWFSFIFFCE